MILLLVAVATGWYIESHSGTTIIHNPVAKTTYVTTANTPVQTFSETDFIIQLQTDWKFIGQTTGPYNFYTWQDTTKYEDNRILDLYVDTIPGMAVSRLQPVSADGNRLQIGTMSDILLTFTGAPASSAQTAQSLPNQLAKWQGINFMCDLSNYNNNSVGTSFAARHDYPFLDRLDHWQAFFLLSLCRPQHPTGLLNFYQRSEEFPG